MDKITLGRLLINLLEDLREDADSGVHLDMTLDEYIKSTFGK